MPDKPPVKWHYSTWGVLILLGLIGPLAFWFLWKSPSFSTASKWFWTLAVLVLTGLLIVTAELLPLLIAQALVGL
jgi:hypothetical protein